MIKKIAKLGISISLIFAMVSLTPLAFAANESTRLIPQTGVIYLNRSSLPGPIHVTSQESVQEKDEIETLWYAAADLVFMQGSEELATIRVKEITKLVIEKLDLTPGHEKIILDVRSGKVLVIKNNLQTPDHLQILSPASAVNVQGMGFELKSKE